MKTNCPYCGAPFEIDEEHLEKKLECFDCRNKFVVSLTATPKLGTMYLDIESTTYPVGAGAEISSIVWWCNNQWHSWVKGVDAPDLFLLFWKHAPWVVSFDRKTLYEPLLCDQFTIEPHPNHLDLRQNARKRGMSGGLQALGEAFGFPRAVGLENRNEETVARLWERGAAAAERKAVENLRYCGAWSVVLTYHLHCFFSEKGPLPMHTSVPYTLDAHFIDSITSRNLPPPAVRADTVKDASAVKPSLSFEPLPLRRKPPAPTAEAAPAKKKIIIVKPHAAKEMADG